MMPGIGGTEIELRERLNAIVRATPPLMRVLSVARRLCLPDWLVFSGAVYQPVLNHLTGRRLDYGIKDYDHVCRCRFQVRTRLAAGGSRIRTIGPRKREIVLGTALLVL